MAGLDPNFPNQVKVEAKMTLSRVPFPTPAPTGKFLFQQILWISLTLC